MVRYACVLQFAKCVNTKSFSGMPNHSRYVLQEHEYFSTLDFDFTEDERSLPTLDFDFIEDKGSLPTLDFDFAEDKGSLPQKSEMFRGISDDLESLPFLFEETATSNPKPKKRTRSVSFSDTVTVYEIPPTPRKMFYSKVRVPVSCYPIFACNCGYGRVRECVGEQATVCMFYTMFLCTSFIDM